MNWYVMLFFENRRCYKNFEMLSAKIPNEPIIIYFNKTAKIKTLAFHCALWLEKVSCTLEFDTDCEL